MIGALVPDCSGSGGAGDAQSPDKGRSGLAAEQWGAGGGRLTGMPALVARLGDDFFGFLWRMANDGYGFGRIEPELAVGAVEAARGQHDQAIHPMNLGHGFPGKRRVDIGPGAVVDQVADLDIGRSDGDSVGHDFLLPENPRAGLWHKGS